MNYALHFADLAAAGPYHPLSMMVRRFLVNDLRNLSSKYADILILVDETVDPEAWDAALQILTMRKAIRVYRKERGGWVRIDDHLAATEI